MISLPKSTRRQVWERVLARLTAPGTRLTACVKTWQLFQGRSGETQDWTIVMLPAIRIFPTSGVWRPSAEMQHAGSLILNVETGTPGTNAGDLMDLWAAIEAQLFSPDQSLIQELGPLGVYSPSIELPAVALDHDGEGKTQFLRGKGSLRFNMHIDA